MKIVKESLSDKLKGPDPKSIVQRIIGKIGGKPQSPDDFMYILNFLDRIVKDDQLNIFKEVENIIDFSDMVDSFFIKAVDRQSINIIDYFLNNYNIKEDNLDYAREISAEYNLNKVQDYFKRNKLM